MRQEPLAHGCEPSLQERLAVLHEVTNELTTDVFWITDWINHRVLFASRAYESIWGRSLQGLYEDSRAWADAIHPEDRERAWQAFVQLDEEGTYDEEYRIVRPDRTIRWVRDRAYPIRDENGRVYRAAGVAQDITERKKAEAANRDLEEQLRQAQKLEAIGTLAGGVAHDFNNLLTVIAGYTEMALDDLEESSPLYPRVIEIRTAAERAASLTRQLLAFSRRQVLEPKILDLNVIVVDMEKMLHRLIGEHIELTTTLDPELAKVKADPGQVEQVLMNLVVNARDAMPRGGQIAIETNNVELDEHFCRQHPPTEPGAYVALSVSDTGCGMDPETRARIFEPFFTTKDRDQGTGLGLATVYGIVKQSHGYIWAVSELGQGSQFRVYLPQAHGAQSETGQPAPAVEGRGGGETILVVEDDQVVRDLVQRILAQSGYSVLEAADGNEGLRVCGRQNARIHLMLTDVALPGMNGPELVDRAAPLRPEMKVLLMSGYLDHLGSPPDHLRPDVAFIKKPFRPGALKRKVREVLDHGAHAGAQSIEAAR